MGKHLPFTVKTLLRFYESMQNADAMSVIIRNKKIFFIIGLMIVPVFFNSKTLAQGCPPFSSTIIVGGVANPGSSYTTLTAAITDLKNCGISQPTVLELSSSYTSSGETFPLVLGAVPGASATNTITIRPASGATGLNITSANATATIDINGGSYWIIDGRPGGTGSLTSTNLAVGNTGGAPAIRFINDGTNNTVKYSNLTSTAASLSSGIVVFGSTTGTTGNDNNIVDNNNINGGGVSYNCIYAAGSTGSTAVNNSGVTISNNNIYDFFNASNATNGIFILAGNTDWTITGNSVYQTALRTYTSGNTHTGISISTAASPGNNFVVTNNSIGGSSANAGGSAWTVAGSFANRFQGIFLNVGSTTASSVQGNTIANFSWSSTSSVSSLPGVWTGIYTSGSGNVNIGTTAANTIGSGTGTGSVTVTTSGTGAISFGIGSSSSGIVSIANNIIGSISAAGTTGSISHSFAGIQTTAGSTVTITSNAIGSAATANSINASNTSTGTTGQHVAGILNSGSGIVTVNNNVISNLNNASTGTGTTTFSPQARGIVTSAGTNTITGNTIANLTNASPYTGASSSASVIGISMTATSGNQTVSQNTIQSLNNSYSSAASTVVCGIFYSGPPTGTHVIGRNFIQTLAVSNNSGNVRGIEASGGSGTSGTTTYQNNMMRLGTGNALNAGSAIYGFYETGGNNNVYHNSIYVGGLPSSGNASTYAFSSILTSNKRNYQNNIMMNARSNTGTSNGKHYAISFPSPLSNLVSDYNDILTTGTGGVLGSFNGSDQNSLSNWQTATGQDAHSLNVDPQFNDPTNTDIHIKSGTPTPVEGTGVSIAAVTDDYDGETRSALSPVDIGADAGNFIAITPPVISYTSLAATCSTSDRTLAATITSVTGVPTSGSTAPRIYYKKGAGGTYISRTGTLTSGNGNSGAWNFTIVNSDMGSVTGGDVIYYYVVAQDVSSPTPYISSNPSGVTSGTVSVHTAPGSPNSYTINSYYTWTGATSSDWSNASNWSCGLPTSATDVVIPGNISNYPVLSSGTGSVNSLTIQSGALLTVNGTLQIAGTINNSGTFTANNGTIEMNGSSAQIIAANTFVLNSVKNLIISNNVTLAGTLKLTGVLSFGSVNNKSFTTGDFLTLASDASGTARISDITNNNANTGNTIVGKATVERYISAKASWRFLTAPVAGNGTAITLQTAYQSANGKGIVLFRPGGGNGFTDDGVATSIRSYNSATQKWEDVSGTTNNNISTTATSAANNAYAVFVTGPHDVSSTTTAYIHGSPQPTTTSVTGSLQTNQQQFTIENGNDKYTLLGNPYASPVDLDAFDAANTGVVKNVYYLWDPSVAGAYGVGGYVTVTRTGSNSFTYAPSTGTEYRYIQSGQAFFVTGKGAGNAVNFQENQKAATTFLTPFRQGTQLEKLNINLSFINQSGGFDITDGVAALYNNKYSTNTTDAEDAAKFTNGTEALSIIRNGKPMSMEARPLISANDTISLNIAKMRTTTYRFDFIPDNLSASGLIAYLQDRYTGTETAINLAANSNYLFTVSGDAGSAASDRFRIIFRANTPLPLNFTLIKAQQKNNSIAVNWQLSSEEDVQHYEVEKSTDGVQFSGRASVTVNNNSAGYEWLDITPDNGNNYYRIKVIAKTGAAKYSPIVNVKTGEGEREIIIYPNPVEGNLLILQLNNQYQGNYSVQLFNSLGQKVFGRTVELSGGSSTVSLLLDKKLSKGIYQLRVEGKGTSIVQTLIVNH